MNSNPPYPSSELSSVPSHYHHHRCTSLSWAAVLAGLTAAMALQVLFMMLGAGLGFAIYNPITNDNPIQDLGTGAVVVQGISAVFSLWFGGWVAGRFTPIASRSSGRLHGFLVWCAATVAGVLVVSMGAGWAIGDLSKLVGGGLSAAGKPVAAAVSGAASSEGKDGAKQLADIFSSYVDEATSRLPGDKTGAAAIRAKREVGLAIARAFNPMSADAGSTDKADAVKKSLVSAGMSPSDADQLVSEWNESFAKVKAETAALKEKAEAAAREAAEKAAKALAAFSLCAFVAFVLGAISATCGGKHGAQCAARHDYVVTVT